MAENKEKMEEFSTEEAVKEAVENAEEMTEEAAPETEAENAESKVEEKDSKKGLKKKEKKKDKRDEQIEQLNDKVMRQMAEFENFRRRTEIEKSQMFATGAKSIVEKILPVIDNLERGFLAISEEEKQTPFAQGIDKIYKQLLSSLEEAGVKPIEAVGQEFNTDYHNAVMHVEDDSLGENVVAEEFQKGYMYKDSVVRHSMVGVVS